MPSCIPTGGFPFLQSSHSSYLHKLKPPKSTLTPQGDKDVLADTELQAWWTEVKVRHLLPIHDVLYAMRGRHLLTQSRYISVFDISFRLHLLTCDVHKSQIPFPTPCRPLPCNRPQEHGHPDLVALGLRTEAEVWGFAGPIPSVERLVHVLATIAWLASGHHAAVNFGQYDFSSLILNASSLVRKPMPAPGSKAYKVRRGLPMPVGIRASA